MRSLADVFSRRCDEGFSGTDCQPSSPLSSSVLSDFESQDALLATWREVIGGEVVTPDMGCGVVSSGSSLYFSKVKQLEKFLGNLDPNAYPRILIGRMQHLQKMFFNKLCLVHDYK